MKNNKPDNMPTENRDKNGKLIGQHWDDGSGWSFHKRFGFIMTFPCKTDAEIWDKK